MKIKTKVKRLPQLPVRDMLVFLALCVLPIASFWLAEYPNVSFYTALLTMSLLVLFGFEVYRPTREKLMYFKYDVNLNIFGLGVVIAFTIIMILFSDVVAAAVHAHSLLTVPMQRLALEYGQVSLPPFWSDTLYQITLVASAEEASKLVVIVAVFLFFTTKIGKLPAAILAVTSAVGGWALLHTFQNVDYQGATMPVMVTGAFIDGLIILGVLVLTQSWLATILTHFGFNWNMLLAQYGYPHLTVFTRASPMIVSKSSWSSAMLAVSPGSFDWMDIGQQLVKIWDNIVVLENQIVSLVIQIVQLTTGLTLSPWIVLAGIVAIIVLLNLICGKILTYITIGIGALIFIYILTIS